MKIMLPGTGNPAPSLKRIGSERSSECRRAGDGIVVIGEDLMQPSLGPFARPVTRSQATYRAATSRNSDWAA